MSLIVDLFAGGGGASRGIERALGRSPDIAIDHDPIALGVHEANHPRTRHLVGDVWHYAPRDVVSSSRVGWLHLSPTCTHFSRAKGAPLDRSEASRVRALAWVGARWARDVRPDVISVENVSELQSWGPLGEDGRVVEKKRGFTFRRWIRSFEREGYRVEWKELRACDYGAPTIRNRLFVIARRDGMPIYWPSPTHGPGTGNAYRSAAECIDWSLPAPSIFGRAKPLVDATLRRIARGVRKHVIEAAEPFIITYYGTGGPRSLGAPMPTSTTHDRFALVVPSLIHLSNGERPGQAPRIYDIERPLSTVVAGGVKHGLTVALLVKNFGGHEGSGASLRDPMGTATTRDHHALVTCMLGDRREEVRSFMRRYRPNDTQGALFGDDDLVRIDGETYAIADIGMRGLVPDELKVAQGLEADYVLDRTADGRRVGTTKQTALVGNSVSPNVAEAIVRANVGAVDRREVA